MHRRCRCLFVRWIVTGTITQMQVPPTSMHSRGNQFCRVGERVSVNGNEAHPHVWQKENGKTIYMNVIYCLNTRHEQTTTERTIQQWQKSAKCLFAVHNNSIELICVVINVQHPTQSILYRVKLAKKKMNSKQTEVIERWAGIALWKLNGAHGHWHNSSFFFQNAVSDYLVTEGRSTPHRELIDANDRFGKNKMLLVWTIIDSGDFYCAVSFVIWQICLVQFKWTLVGEWKDLTRCKRSRSHDRHQVQCSIIRDSFTLPVLLVVIFSHTPYSTISRYRFTLLLLCYTFTQSRIKTQ